MKKFVACMIALAVLVVGSNPLEACFRPFKKIREAVSQGSGSCSTCTAPAASSSPTPSATKADRPRIFGNFYPPGPFGSSCPGGVCPLLK